MEYPVKNSILLYCHHPMQATETQINQIKLLRDYIAALERQIAATHKELAEVGKLGSFSESDVQRMEAEYRRSRSENQRLREENRILIEANVKVDGLEQQLGSLMDASKKGQAAKEELLARVEQMAMDNHNLYQFHQQLSAQYQEQARALQFYITESEQKSNALQLLQKQLQQSQRHNAGLKQQMLLRQVELAQQKQKVKNLQAGQQENNSVYNGETFRLTELLINRQIEYKRLQESHSILEKTASTQIQDVMRIKRTYEELGLKVRQLQQEKKVLQDKKSALQSAFLSTQANLQQSISLNTNLSQQNQIMKGQIQKAKTELQKQKDSCLLLTNQLSKAKQRHLAYTKEIKEDLGQKIRQKDEKAQSALRQIEELKAIIKKHQQLMQQIQSQSQNANLPLKQQMKHLEKMHALQFQQLNRLRMQQSSEKDSFQSKTIQIQSLKYMVTILKDSLAKQTSKQQSLLEKIQAKKKKIAILEESNTTLRQMVISSKISQEFSMKELQSLKTTTNINSNISHTSVESKPYLIIPKQRKPTRALLSERTPQTSRERFLQEADSPELSLTVQEQGWEAIGARARKLLWGG